MGISLILNFFTTIYIVKNKLFLEVCEQIYWYDIDRTGNRVPDEETAKRIAEAIIDADEMWTWDTDVDYEMEISFDEQSYRWEVAYLPKIPEGMVLIDGGKYVWIRKDNGEIEVYR